MDNVGEVVKGLTEERRRDLTERWDQFCDQDELSGGRDQDEYVADMMRDGFLDVRDVDSEDLEDPFAWDRGIEPGGLIYVLTPLGLAARASLIEGEIG